MGTTTAGQGRPAGAGKNACTTRGARAAKAERELISREALWSAVAPATALNHVLKAVAGATALHSGFAAKSKLHPRCVSL